MFRLINYLLSLCLLLQSSSSCPFALSSDDIVNKDTWQCEEPGLNFMGEVTSSFANNSDTAKSLLDVCFWEGSEQACSADLGHLGGDHHRANTLDGDSFVGIFVANNRGQMSDVFLGGTVDGPKWHNSISGRRADVDDDTIFTVAHLLENDGGKNSCRNSVADQDITETLATSFNLMENFGVLIGQSDVVD